MGVEVGGILGLIILILDIWAIIKILGSSAGTGSKVLWIVVIVLLPLIGLLLWYLLGPKGSSARAGI
ncbi:MAG: PLDc N-terminal domain-containing protein [Gammaproteobacteria bacterium]|nr:PLDc N-terminal domain-containing protein [Gammaproteobacteria bacterium]